MPDTRAPIVDGPVIEGGAGLKIPVLDLGPYLAGEPGARERAAAELGAACESIGFFFIAHHGVPQSLIDGAFAAAEQFHSLPLERKLAVRALEEPIGYLPVGGQTQRAELYGVRSKHPDRSASFYIRDEYSADHPDRLAKKPWVFDNRWPTDLPGFRERTLAYFAVMHALMTKLLPLQSLALGLPAEWLASHEGFKPMNCTLRLLNYPPRIAANEGQYGIGPHTDFGYCTILAQAEKPGLEILTRSGEWVQAPAYDGMLLVNNADLLQRWSNDRFRSAPHRVYNLEGDERYSIPFFVSPRWDVKLACLPSCQSADDPPKYAPISRAEYQAELKRTVYELPGKGG
jgi:isopenicillin N synthase-like dioxygenase